MKGKTKALLLGMAVGAVYCQNAWVDHHTLSFSSPQLPAAFEGFSILHLSDLHFGPSSAARRRALPKKGSRPDLIAVTGDLLDHYSPENLKAAKHWARRAAGIAPVYFVPGNHEARMGKKYAAVKAGLEQAGARVLEQGGVLLRRGEASIRLLGLKDPDFFSGQKEYLAALHGLAEGKTGFSILLSHRPERLEDYAREGFSLILSGHAHGGQVRLPGIGGLYAPHQGIFPRYTAGFYTKKESCMLVSRGIGNCRHCPRLFDPPEAALLVLHSKQ